MCIRDRLKPGITVNNNLDEIFPVADYITLHVPLTPDTKQMICDESIDKIKNTVRILNFARGDLADSQAVVNALEAVSYTHLDVYKRQP